MKRILLVVALLTAVDSAHAVNFFKNPHEWFKSVDRRRRQLTIAAADVATLGLTRAQRKKAKADAEKAVAEQRLQGTAANLENAIRNQSVLVGIYQSEKATVDKVSRYVDQLVASNKLNIEITRGLFEFIQNDRTKLVQVQKLLTNQRNQILEMSNIFMKNDIPEIAAIRETLKGQVAVYDAQVRGFPGQDMPQRNMQEWFNEISDTVSEMTYTIGRLNAWIKNDARLAGRRLIAAQKTLEQLKGKK